MLLPDGSTPRERLLALCANGNKPFTQGLHPGVENILGLRVPDLRALAKEIAHADWRDYLKSPGDLYMEERMLHGLVLGQIKVDDAEEYLRLVDQFVMGINSWSVCDTFSFAGKKRFVDANHAIVLERLTAYMHSSTEYAVRFGVVMLMHYFLDSGNTDWFMNQMESVTHQGYYVRMAIAWAVSVAFVKSPDAMTARLRGSSLDDFTFNKAISKITDSYRVTAADKETLRTLRRKSTDTYYM